MIRREGMKKPRSRDGGQVAVAGVRRDRYATLIFQAGGNAANRLTDVAPARQGGCWGFIGPFPPPLSMRASGIGVMPNSAQCSRAVRRS